LYLRASGPTFNESHWRKVLEPGETFASVPVAAGAVVGGVDEVGAALTHYRRRIRRANEDNEKLPVIFNDYMNCLFGDPTTEKLIPLIDAAAACGCEYFCIDCGWYSEGPWWDGVGEWLPSKQRFPDGLPAVLKYIRSKGMVPGLWLEIEVMGIKNPKAGRVGDEWFFQRDGKRIIDHSRYQLDFRNPKVVEHANEVIDRLVREYGVGYIKMDYNINAGVGTDRASDSAGDGLLEHNRAYLEWVDDVFARYPDLVIENCSSGGMRCDYALLSRHSIFSTSDQTDYVKYAWIAAGAPTGVTPEQAAVWSYPLKAGDREEVIFNMVSAMLMRVHQSGHLAELSEERRALVKEGLDFYKTIRGELRECVPFWPLGLPRWGDSWVALGMKWPKRTYVAVWRTDGGPETMTLPIRHLAGKKAVSARIGYPSQCDQTARWHGASGQLAITLKQRTARVIVIE
jgi:alpha-galactosidase